MATASVAVMRSLPLTLFPPYSTTDFTILNTQTHTHARVTSCPVVSSGDVRSLSCRHYPALSLRHSPPAQLVHQRRQDAAAVAFVSQSVEHDQAGGVPICDTGVLQKPPDLLESEKAAPCSVIINYRTTSHDGETDDVRLDGCLAAFIVDQSAEIHPVLQGALQLH